VKVINLGLPKTGTTTLARALRRAGYHVADHRIQAKQTKRAALEEAFVADLLYQGYFETGDPCALLDEFDAITEMSHLRGARSMWPQMDFALIRAIRLHHPEVRFVASGRDAFAISQSMLGWSNLATSRLPKADVPGLPSGYGETTKERIQWIEGHYDNLRAFFGDDPAFFLYDVAADGIKDQLAEFLGRPLPWWGHTNRSPVGARA
jgi:hypothetical protein